MDLARSLDVPLIDDAPAAAAGSDLLLVVTARGLELRELTRRNARPIRVDFAAGPLARRRLTGVSRKQPIARAIGIRAGHTNVLDATAGWGRDTFLLACLGCTVVAIERSAVLAALLADALDRARGAGDARLTDILDRITLVQADARDVLAGWVSNRDGERSAILSMRPDVIYLDPMYAHERKSALSKVEIRVCRMLVGDDPDANELFVLARRCAPSRVVVKRHRHAPPLAPDPDMSFEGTNTRYDVYLTRKT